MPPTERAPFSSRTKLEDRLDVVDVSDDVVLRPESGPVSPGTLVRRMSMSAFTRRATMEERVSLSPTLSS
jgi:hypothetical protein